MTCPTPPTVMPSVGAGTEESVVQVPCACPICGAMKVPITAARITRDHLLTLGKWLNIFLAPLQVFVFGGSPWKRAAEDNHWNASLCAKNWTTCSRPFQNVVFRLVGLGTLARRHQLVP